MDKPLIFLLLKYLRRYNETRRSLSLDSVYISEHLPKQFQDERKTLLPIKKPKNATKKLIGKPKMAIIVFTLTAIKLKNELSVYQLCAQHV